jgi:hypothetical protein
MNLKQKINIAEIASALRNLHRRARLSVFEISALAVALGFALTVTFLYLTRIQPLRNQVAELQTRQQNLLSQLSKVSVEQRRAAEQSANAEKILDSLTKFEESLKPDESGMTQILNEIDALCTSHKIITSGGSTYNFTEPVLPKDENDNVIRVNREKIDFYPVFGIDTTVTGDYRNLRRFIFDLERSKQFLVIKSVQFQGEGDKYGRTNGSPGNPNPQQQKIQLSSPEAIPVSLKIEMDTYFQKPSVKTQ